MNKENFIIFMSGIVCFRPRPEVAASFPSLTNPVRGNIIRKKHEVSAMKTPEYTPTKKFSLRPGLYLENGKVMHEGKPFYGIGVNYFGAFLNEFQQPENGELREILSLLKDHGIKFMRVCFGGFWPTDIRAMFENEESYWETMDRVVAAAEEFDVGIIPCFFWNPGGINDYFGEPRNAWAKEDSATRRFMKDYVVKIISRYKESPAMWMWEFSNEFNLQLDLPNRRELREGSKPPLQLGCRIRPTEEDDLMSDFAVPVMEYFAKLCRSCDVYERMISSGNSEPRPTQYQQRVFDMWPDRPDTRAEMAKTLEWHNPAPMDCVSIHSYDLLHRFEGTETYKGLFTAFMEECERLGRALFVGEFSGLNKTAAMETIDAIVETRVPLSAIWAIGRVEYSLDREPDTRALLLNYIKNANEKLNN